MIESPTGKEVQSLLRLWRYVWLCRIPKSYPRFRSFFPDLSNPEPILLQRVQRQESWTDTIVRCRSSYSRVESGRKAAFPRVLTRNCQIYLWTEFRLASSWRKRWPPLRPRKLLCSTVFLFSQILPLRRRRCALHVHRKGSGGFGLRGTCWYEVSAQVPRLDSLWHGCRPYFESFNFCQVWQYRVLSCLSNPVFNLVSCQILVSSRSRPCVLQLVRVIQGQV